MPETKSVRSEKRAEPDILACRLLPPLFAKNALGDNVVLLPQVLDNLVGHGGRTTNVEDGVFSLFFVPNRARQGNVVDAVCPRNHWYFCR